MNFHFDDLFDSGPSSRVHSSSSSSSTPSPSPRGYMDADEEWQEAVIASTPTITTTTPTSVSAVPLPLPQSPMPPPRRSLRLTDFTILKHIGEGAYGRVYQVKENATGNIFAMKVLKKHHLLKLNAVENTIAERDILRKVRHPFVVRLHSTFQTELRVAFVMDFVVGGQLFFHLREEAIFNESMARFYTAELVLALEYLHSLRIVHRDLKPENILVGAKGHLILTDFGLAKENVDEMGGANTWCGTIAYMAPEIVKKNEYGTPSDLWSLGILLYDMLAGNPPFRHKNLRRLQEMICAKKINMPGFWQASTHAIIRGLTQKMATKRFTMATLKAHPFFAEINWSSLLMRKIRPPFVPNLRDREDLKYFDSETLNKPTTFSPAQILAKSQDDRFFKGFSYVRSVSPASHTWGPGDHDDEGDYSPDSAEEEEEKEKVAGV
eukprot:TRINITY_DN2445_c0_g2_i1.p1 TRINITY_DN2445_c0_g2~~TRINITY_DN2445_c0_g2_i1.p1  ORF type:complete len:437 (+),score=122.50 TRINITY_DN2445_c0_g2_i1:33-1343(+)